jgi:Leucine-rich repeat (LRR) protein
MGELKPHLSLWKQRLGVIPEEVWLRIDLQTLVLADNDLTEISERVGDLSKLRTLDLGHNSLRELPVSLGRLETSARTRSKFSPRSSRPWGVSLSFASRTIT